MVSEQTKSTADSIKNYIKQNGIEYQSLYDLLDVAKVAFEKENDTEWALKVTSYIKDCCRWAIQSNVEVLQMDDLYWKTMKSEAPYHFESFLFYMEKNRPQRKKFYENRKKALKVVVDDLQDLEDGKIEFYGLSMPPRVGKSTICIFFYAWIIGKRPDSHNAMAGHSGLLANQAAGLQLSAHRCKIGAQQSYLIAQLPGALAGPSTALQQNMSLLHG